MVKLFEFTPSGNLFLIKSKVKILNYYITEINFKKPIPPSIIKIFYKYF